MNGEQNRGALAGLAAASLLVALLPMVPLGHVIVTRPILAGIVVAWFVRHYGLPPVAAALAAIVPVVALVSADLLTDRQFAAEVSSNYMLAAWALAVTLYVLAVSAGALLGRQSRTAV